jgi:hypothetical protein
LFASCDDANKACEQEHTRIQCGAIAQHLPVDALVSLVGSYISAYAPFVDGRTLVSNDEDVAM